MKIIVGVVAATLSFGASAEWRVPRTGFDLLRALQQGVVRLNSDEYANAIAAQAYVFGVAETTSTPLCFPPGELTNDDIYLVVRAYLEQNTNLLSGKARELIEAALHKAFPCPTN
jgi:hypothetical protein